jgi:hypothetical protein
MWGNEKKLFARRAIGFGSDSSCFTNSSPIGFTNLGAAEFRRLATMPRIEPLSPHLDQTRLSQLNRLPDLDGMPEVTFPTAEF